MKTQLFKLNKQNLFFAVCNYFAIVLAILLIVVSCNKNDEITGGGSSGGGGGIGGNKGSSSIVGRDHKNFNLLIGTWQGQDSKNTNEVYIFDGTNFSAEPSTYSIEVLEISWTTDTEGFFYGKYLSNGNADVIGKYYAVSFTNLSETDLSISGALNGTHGSAAVEGYAADTLEEAKTNFTIEKGSFAQYTQCKKN